MIERQKIGKKELSSKQQLWLKRSRLLWRLKGMSVGIDSNIVTPKEEALLKMAFRCIRQVCNDSTESSRELGFNAVERCGICGKPVYKNGLCKKCNELWQDNKEFIVPQII